MSRLDKITDFIERHKYGILVTLIIHVGAFVFFQLYTYKQAVIFEPWDFQSINKKAPDNIVVTPDQIETQQEAELLHPKKVTSFVKNKNDKRKRSTNEAKNYTSYKENGDPKEVEKEYEQKMRDKILGKNFKEHPEKEKANTDLETKKDKLTSPQKKEGATASKEAVGGATMVSYSLASRYPLNHNDWYVRNPGYTCGNVNGIVVMNIRVDNGGHVIDAKIDDTRSKNATYCMKKQAKKYALLSRFNFDGGSPKEQYGTISYRFVYNK